MYVLSNWRPIQFVVFHLHHQYYSFTCTVFYNLLNDFLFGGTAWLNWWISYELIRTFFLSIHDDGISLILIPLAFLKCFKNPFTMDFCRNPISKHYSDVKCTGINI